MDRKSWYNALYNNYGRDWEGVIGKDKIQCIRKALQLIGNHKKVLDIGCYNGYISKIIQEQGNEVIGVDMSDKAVELCKKKGFVCVQRDLEKKLPFHDEEFDAVFMGEIIEHIFDTDGLLREARRVLKKNGVLVLTTPNLAAPSRRIKLFFGINPGIESGTLPLNKNSGHIRYFTCKALAELLERSGFKITKIKGDVVLLKIFKSYKAADIFPGLSWTIIVKGVKQ